MIRDFGIEALGPVLILAGVLQMVAGQLKVGQWFRAMSPAVIHGMLAGIGVLIFASQFHVMLDDRPKQSGIANLLSIPEAIYAVSSHRREQARIGRHHRAGHDHQFDCLDQVAPFAVETGPWRSRRGRACHGNRRRLGWGVNRVEVPSNLWDAVRLPSASTLSMLQNPALLIAAVAMAFIASAETLLSAAAVDRMQSLHKTDYDKELRAQGVGNFSVRICGALPMTGVIVRSSANVQAGAQTRMSTILHGMWLLLFTAALAMVLRAIPTAALGAILVYTGYKLVNIDNVRHLARYGKFRC
jgi:MFS superfamily sulfate permease-like transporter